MHLTDQPLRPEALLEEVAGPGRGATTLFVGTVRGRHAGRAVAGIDYSAYPPMAERVLARIESELAAEHPGAAVRIVHRTGALSVGEISFVIAIGAPRRVAAFAAARLALERVKREVPIWKHERYADGTAAWREEEPLVRP